MDVYIGLGLLSAAIVILAFIMLDNWSKDRKRTLSSPISDPEFTLQNEGPALEKKPQPSSRADHLLIMSIMAKPDHRFGSYDLLQAISAAGFQFGEMNIFHYYLGKTKLFSLACANKPGEFDLDNIGNFFCTGLMLFMDMKQVPNPEHAFQTMREVAERLAEDLNGELCAAPHVPWNETLEKQYQHKILQLA